MAARTTRRISQRDSRHRACTKTASRNEKPHRAATITACADPPAQRRSAQPWASKSPACLNKKNRSPRDRHHLRRSTRASIAASPVRGQIQKPVGSRPLRLRSFARDQLLHPATFRSRGSRCRGMKLNYGSAIKTSHKGRRISKLQNSNRL